MTFHKHVLICYLPYTIKSKQRVSEMIKNPEKKHYIKSSNRFRRQVIDTSLDIFYFTVQQFFRQREAVIVWRMQIISNYSFCTPFFCLKTEKAIPGTNV